MPNSWCGLPIVRRMLGRDRPPDLTGKPRIVDGLPTKCAQWIKCLGSATPSLKPLWMRMPPADS